MIITSTTENQKFDKAAMYSLEVNIGQQVMNLFQHGKLIRTYNISTGKNGAGEMRDSGKTPRGRHVIRAKIGAGLPENSVLVGRRPTGELYHPALRAQFPDRDWILTRILWLSGAEPGKNRLGNVDTMRRYIYIHGSPDDVKMGEPGSKGCIRMRNQDVVQLFDLIPAGTPILITD
jgi:lipoprotein-anchoring transpeptidase ErfK/SrfK